MTRISINQHIKNIMEMRKFVEKHGTKDVSICFHSHYEIPCFSLYKNICGETIEKIKGDVLFKIEKSITKKQSNDIINGILEELESK